MAKHEYYVVQGKTLDNVAETMKTVLGVDKDTPIRFDEITNNEKAEQVTENVDAQAEVIEQIKTALNDKSSIGVKEIIDIIDQSGVLDSTDGTATEKVEQLIEKASDEALWYMRTTEASDRIGGGWFHKTNLTRLPRMDLSKTTSLYLFCASAKIERIEQYLNTELCKLFQQAFSGTPNLTYMKGICTKNAIKVENMFYESAIEIIDEPFDFSNVTSGSAFQKANSLKEVRFVSETIKISQIFSSANLSAESIQSIIDGLATVETAQTLTLHADVKAKLTQEQLATITSKNWNLA